MIQPPRPACPAMPVKRPDRLRPALLGGVGRAALLAMPLALGLGVAHPGQAVAQGVTVSGTYTSTLTGFATATNPLTVTSGGTISTASGQGISGDSSGAWTILNGGTVQSGSSNAIGLSSGGSIANLGTPATITGYYDGIRISGSAGTVMNQGTIQGGGGFTMASSSAPAAPSATSAPLRSTGAATASRSSGAA